MVKKFGTFNPQMKKEDRVKKQELKACMELKLGGNLRSFLFFNFTHL